MSGQRIAAIVLASCALVACDRCGAPGVAELLEGEGTIERNVAGASAWSSAPIGQRFELGDAARTGEASTARLRVGARGGVRMQPRTVLRFLGERPERGARVQLETGEVELESDEAIDLETDLGAVTLEPGARVVVRGGGADGARVQVIAGRVVFEEEGEQRVAEAGDAFVLAVGRVIFEDAADATPFAAPPDPDPTPDPDPAPVADADPAPDSAADPDADPDTDPDTDADADSDADAEPIPVSDPSAAIEPSPARADLAIPAGESPTVHDPSGTPTAVRIELGASCPGRATVTLRAGRRTTRWAGEGSVIVLVAPGRARYAIDCEAGPDPRGGAITVRRDDGSARLQSVPPRNVVDSDGRTYDVLYQNALPILTVRWREGSGASVLHVASGGRERTFPAPGARVELRSGELGEGTHRLYLTSGARRSPDTTLRIRFDNAAPAAMIREPSSRDALTPGASVRVSGSVLPGTDVRAGGRTLETDVHLRFSADVPVPADAGALAVRFSHPRRGVHYYLRHVAGS